MESFHGVVCAVGGGKGGVGKSLVAANTACALALEGYEVILLDADLAGANVHTLFGIKHPPLTLNEFVARTVGTIEDVLVPTALKTLHLVCGATDFIDLANPGHARKQRLLRAVGRLPADYILVDIGAGATYNNLDFFNMADIGILVTTPEPTAILSGYEFLKLAVRRKLLSACAAPGVKEPLAALLGGAGTGKVRKIGEVVEAMKEVDPAASKRITELIGEMNVGLVVNNTTASEGETVHRALAGIAMQYLRVPLPLLGRIPRSVEIERSVRAMTPVMISGPSAAGDPYREIARRIVASGSAGADGAAGADRPPVPLEPPIPPRPEAGAAAPASRLCLNDVAARDGRNLHVQTEDLGSVKLRVQTLVFLDGRIVFSKESRYADLGLEGASREEVCEKVRWQHRGILSGIRAGKIDRVFSGGE